MRTLFTTYCLSTQYSQKMYGNRSNFLLDRATTTSIVLKPILNSRPSLPERGSNMQGLAVRTLVVFPYRRLVQRVSAPHAQNEIARSGKRLQIYS